MKSVAIRHVPQVIYICFGGVSTRRRKGIIEINTQPYFTLCDSLQIESSSFSCFTALFLEDTRDWINHFCFLSSLYYLF